MAPESSSTSKPDPQQVPFDTGCLGCLLVVMAVGAAVFGIAAFDGAQFANLADSPSPRNWLGVLAPFRLGGVNIAVLVLAIYLVWEGIKLARRFVDMKAVWIDGETIRFHPTLRQKPVPLSAVLDVSLDTDDMHSVLVLRATAARRIAVTMVDHDAAKAFSEEIEQRLAQRGPA